MADTFTIDRAHTAVLSMDCQAGIVSIYTREGKDAFWFESQAFSIMLVLLA
jgi:hypothetical protein